MSQARGVCERIQETGMRKLLIIALGVASLGASFVPPAFGAIKTFMQLKAERDVRDRHSVRSNFNAAKTGRGADSVAEGTGVYTLQ